MMGLRQKLKKQEALQVNPKVKQSPQRNNKVTGGAGEDLASILLSKRGYKILTRNYKTKFAEIDIIAMEGDTVVFVEVKARKSKKYGMPYEAVDKKKIYKIKMGANAYIKEMGLKNRKFRIDVVSLVIGDEESLKLYKVY